MSARLRQIALTVEQLEGGYGSVLFESAGGRLLAVDKARQPSRSYIQTLQAGYEQLALLSASGLHERGIGHNASEAATAAPLELTESNHAI